MKITRLKTALIAPLFAMLFLAAAALPAQTQGSGWSAPALIARFDGDIHNPYLVSGRNGGLFLFWTYQGPRDNNGANPYEEIYFTNLSSTKWDKPNDIFSLPSASNVSAAVDDTGILHLIWHSTNNRILYSNARFDEAGSAVRWSAPQVIGEANLSAHIVAGSRRALHIVYPGLESKGVYYITSSDGGASWSVPVNIAPAASKENSADMARLSIGEDGALNVTWTEFTLPGGWPPAGIFFSRSEDGGSTWSKAFEIAGENYDQSNIIAAGKELHIVYNAQIALRGRYHRMSTDGGKTWSMVTVLTEEGGTEGMPLLALDSSGTIHMVSAYGGCAWHRTLSSSQWSAPECVSPRKGIIEEPAMDIRSGNQLVVVFWEDRKTLWASTMKVPAASIKPQPFFTPEPTSTPAPTRAVEKTAPAQRTPTALSGADAVPRTPGNPALPVYAAAGATIAVIALGIFARQAILNRQR